MILDGACEGFLCIGEPWPGMMRTLYGNHQRFIEGYFRLYPGFILAVMAVVAMRTVIIGSPGVVDDVINVADID